MTTIPGTYVYRCPHCGVSIDVAVRAFEAGHRCPKNKQRWTVFKEQTTEGEQPQ